MLNNILLEHAPHDHSWLNLKLSCLALHIMGVQLRWIRVSIEVVFERHSFSRLLPHHWLELHEDVRRVWTVCYQGVLLINRLQACFTVEER